MPTPRRPASDRLVEIVEGQGAMLLYALGNTLDVDDTILRNMTVHIDLLPDGPLEFINITARVAGITVNVVDAHNIELLGPAPSSDFATLLRSLEYRNNVALPGFRRR
jgi:hypothetical protein